MSVKKIHIDENVTVRTDEEADAAFSEENDIAFYEEGKGIVKVPRDRWEKAQRTERKHWMTLGIESKDDRNFYHADRFDQYKSVSERVFKNALEVGCGPFTNLRLIGTHCKIENCSLNDPLIESYLSHPNCSYTSKSLTLNNTGSGLFAKLFNKKVPIKEIYPCAFEEIASDRKFDLMVIINVIEHCFDLSIFFDKIKSLLSDDGILIFEDKLFTTESLEKDIHRVYDAAHPLRVNKEVVLKFIRENFTEKFYSVKPNQIEVEGMSFEWEDLYFIGQKK